MENFILVTEENTDHVLENDENYLKVMNVTSSIARVSDEGHELLPGQKAFVKKGQKDLERSLSKGIVVRLNQKTAESTEKEKKIKVQFPKEPKVSVQGVAPEDSDQTTRSPKSKNEEDGLAGPSANS